MLDIKYFKDRQAIFELSTQNYFTTIAETLAADKFSDVLDTLNLLYCCKVSPDPEIAETLLSKLDKYRMLNGIRIGVATDDEVLRNVYIYNLVRLYNRDYQRIVTWINGAFTNCNLLSYTKPEVNINDKITLNFVSNDLTARTYDIHNIVYGYNLVTLNIDTLDIYNDALTVLCLALKYLVEPMYNKQITVRVNVNNCVQSDFFYSHFVTKLESIL